MSVYTITAIKKALEEFPSMTLEFTPTSSEGNSIIRPTDEFDGRYFTVIGCGDKQNALGQMMTLAVNALPELLSTLESLQSENERLNAELKREAELATHMANDCNDEQARAEAAEAEVARLQTELALSKPLYSRRQIEARVKLLEEALKPVAEKYDSITPDAADVAKGFATHPDNMQDDQLALITLRIGDLRRVRNVLASTGGEHHAE